MHVGVAGLFYSSSFFCFLGLLILFVVIALCAKVARCMLDSCMTVAAHTYTTVLAPILVMIIMIMLI